MRQTDRKRERYIGRDRQGERDRVRQRQAETKRQTDSDIATNRETVVRDIQTAVVTETDRDRE